jgi:hypothetical protein
VIARRQPPAKKRQGGQGEREGWRPVLWRPKTNHEPGLAAVKHAQGVAERAAQGERYRKAGSALASVQSAAKAEWPEAMRQELAGCKTPADHRAWSEGWAEHIAGRVVGDVARPAGATGGAGQGGHQPS